MHLIWKRVIDSQAEKLKELDKEIRPFRQNWEEADSMKSSVESLQNRVTELESVDKSSGQAARNTGKAGGAGEGQVREGPGTGDTCLGLLQPQLSAEARTGGVSVVHGAPEQDFAGAGAGAALARVVVFLLVERNGSHRLVQYM